MMRRAITKTVREFVEVHGVRALVHDLLWLSAALIGAAFQALFLLIVMEG